VTVPVRASNGGSFFDREFKTETVRIMPGEFFVTPEDLGISTVLGSCVSACLRDPVAGIGGMNHFLLPSVGIAARDLDSFIVSAEARYGVHAMELTINALLRLGARRDRLEAKVFGGAAVIDSFINLNVGAQNARFVLDFLERESIALIASDLGGTRPRRVHYQPRSGTAFIKYLVVQEISTIKQRERSYYLEAVNRTKPNEPELFS
jgi:chemotaxis protein CheD